MAVISITILISFKTGGMWKKTNTYIELPEVKFDSNCYFIVTQDNGDPFDYYFWSPFDELNQLQHDRLMAPIVSVTENDVDDNGVTDYATIEIKFKYPEEKFEVKSLHWMLFYKFTLNRRSIIQANGVIFDEIHRPTNLASYFVQSDLVFDQRKPLPSYGNYHFKNDLFSKYTDDIDENSTGTEFNYGSVSYQPYEIRKQAMLANYTLKMDRKVDFWEPKSAETTDYLKLSFEFHVLASELVYETDASELLKWVWIQILAIFVIVNCVFQQLTAVFIENGVFGTLVRHNKVDKLE
ncbi:unnamed protein product [Bursaphelenchus okinawaensis]|uniref:Transmembrane protein 231 n=1 Tax=Bursaphelenchus okinawaensis TaxID=465554 RepID=A0A811L154_9BILA|nr:unnamed protein product [Bursaphelenchus okinawaensis]CAG9114624.1 unnamed protein product [Bursaphelenchus okinawaensis]